MITTKNAKLADTPEAVRKLANEYADGLQAIDMPLGVRLCALGQIEDAERPAILISKVDDGQDLASETDL